MGAGALANALAENESTTLSKLCLDGIGIDDDNDFEVVLTGANRNRIFWS